MHIIAYLLCLSTVAARLVFKGAGRLNPLSLGLELRATVNSTAGQSPPPAPWKERIPTPQGGGPT